MNFFKSIFTKSPEITTSVSNPPTDEQSRISTLERTAIESLTTETDPFATPEKAKPADLSETDAIIRTGLENVPNKHELMRHFNMTERLVAEIAPHIKAIFDGKREYFDKKRSIVNDWVKDYLPQEWQNALAERDQYKGKRSGLPENIKEIRDRADEIMEKVKYRVNVIRDSVEWDKRRVGVSTDLAGGCATKDGIDDDESVDISLAKMQLRANPKPPVRLDPSHVPRPASPPRSGSNRVVHRATAVVINNNNPVFISEPQVVAAVPEEDDLNTVISDLSDFSFPSIDTVHANPLDDN